MTDHFAWFADHHGDRAVVVLLGELDPAEVGAARLEILDRVAADPAARWSIDASSVTFVGSSGVRLLIEVADAIEVRPVAVIGASPVLRRLLDVTGAGDALVLTPA